jgi:hypothetical protein
MKFIKFLPLGLIPVLTLYGCSSQTPQENWDAISVVADVVGFEEAGSVKYDFNHEQHLEAASILKIVSPEEYRGTVVKYFHSGPLPEDSFWRKAGVRITYMRPRPAIPGDMGLSYGSVEAQVVKPGKEPSQKQP